MYAAVQSNPILMKKYEELRASGGHLMLLNFKESAMELMNNTADQVLDCSCDDAGNTKIP